MGHNRLRRSAAGRHRDPLIDRWRPLAVGGARVVVSAVSLVLLLAIGYGWYNFQSLNAHRQTVGLGGLGRATPTASESGATRGVQHVDGTAQNILLVGIDSRAGLSAAQKSLLHVGQHDQTTSTDTIMIVHVPADGRRATLLSIPRDTWVDIPGHPAAKINAAYADGYYHSGARTVAQQRLNAAQLLLDTVKRLTGEPIDHYVAVGFNGFYDIVKAIGHIHVNLCHSVDDTYRHNLAAGETGGSGFKMSAGPHNLNAVQALEFVRQRHNIPGPVTDDFGREVRQRYFLSAAFKRVLSAGVLLNPLAFQSLIRAVDNAFTLSPEFSIQSFAEQMSDLSTSNIAGHSIPTTPATIDGQDALRVDVPAVQRFIKKLFYGTPARSTPVPTRTTRLPAASTSVTTARPACVN